MTDPPLPLPGMNAASKKIGGVVTKDNLFAVACNSLEKFRNVANIFEQSKHGYHIGGGGRRIGKFAGIQVADDSLGVASDEVAPDIGTSGWKKTTKAHPAAAKV